jgi:hypothetical protein
VLINGMSRSDLIFSCPIKSTYSSTTTDFNAPTDAPFAMPLSSSPYMVLLLRLSTGTRSRVPNATIVSAAHLWSRMQLVSHCSFVRVRLVHWTGLTCSLFVCWLLTCPWGCFWLVVSEVLRPQHDACWTVVLTRSLLVVLCWSTACRVQVELSISTVVPWCSC